jgi:hypothetical protein
MLKQQVVKVLMLLALLATLLGDGAALGPHAAAAKTPAGSDLACVLIFISALLVHLGRKGSTIKQALYTTT